MENFTKIEEKIILIDSLLELVTAFCENKCDVSGDLSSLSVAMGYILKKQKELMKELDTVMIDNFKLNNN